MSTITSSKGIISTTNYLASEAAYEIINKSGNAIDAALAASGVLSVTSQHQCGLGGDLFAIVFKKGKIFALNASGYSGSNIEHYSKETKTRKINTFKDKRLITIPGAVDGWMKLHKKFGNKELDVILDRSIKISKNGFKCDQSLLDAIEKTRDTFKENPLNNIKNINQIVKRPKISKQLKIIAKHGRTGFYEGIFGEEFIKFSEGIITAKDLKRNQAQWVKPISYNFFGEKFWTIPPNSQAILILETLKKINKKIKKIPKSIEDFQIKIINEMISIGGNRDSYLSEFFNTRGHDTNYMCIVDRNGMGISLVQSNAHGFGSHCVLKKSGVFLHNRGLGFIKNDNKFYPKNKTKPPSTLCPLIISKNKKISTLLGTMGADSQPQIILQNWINNIYKKDIFSALSSPRWIIGGNYKKELFPFNTWKNDKKLLFFFYEKNFPKKILKKLFRHKNLKLKKCIDNQNLFGHCQMIVKNNRKYSGYHDPRSITGSTIAL